MRLAGTLAALTAGMAWCALAADRLPGAPGPDRGEALYELRCLSCHATSVHGREKRVARDFGEIRTWVERWNATLRLDWSSEEIDDVAIHLNRRYYRYPCPPTACKVVSLRTAAPAVAPD
jgi:hypothetical protein